MGVKKNYKNLGGYDKMEGGNRMQLMRAGGIYV